MEFHHISVLLEETVNGLLTDPDGIYVDCTLGGAGHSSRIVDKLTPSGRLIGIDQDPAALAAAKEKLENASCHVDLVASNFKELDSILAKVDAPLVDGILFDLGVSSHQLDTAERGFSYMQDAPLDMRMDPTAAFSAHDVVNSYEEAELSKIFKEYGEERWAKRIAKFIVEARKDKPIETTGELVDLIKKAIPAAVRSQAGGHPAKRTFQAIRIEVNNELGILADTFRSAVQHLKPGGRIAIITFHSLEDRIAKQTLQSLAKGCICPPKLPICMCHHQPEIKILGKPLVATIEELAHNSRAKSAKLRIAEKKVIKDDTGGMKSC